METPVFITVKLTSPQWPAWGQKKVAVVDRGPLWRGRGVIYDKFVLGSAIVAKFMLVSTAL